MMTPGTVDESWFGRYIRRSIGAAGIAFCVLFTLSFMALCLHQFAKGAWHGSGFVETLAEISGASFAVATVMLTIGGTFLLLERIFLGDGRIKHAEELARREERELAIRADKNRRQDESIEQAMDRLRLESREQRQG